MLKSGSMFCVGIAVWAMKYSRVRASPGEGQDTRTRFQHFRMACQPAPIGWTRRKGSAADQE